MRPAPNLAAADASMHNAIVLGTADPDVALFDPYEEDWDEDDWGPDPMDDEPEETDEYGTGTGTRIEEPEEPEEPTYPNQGGACTPYGAAPASTKPYWYIVQPEDIGSFWRIPEKFNLPAKKGTGWTWHELRNANLDWKGGFVTQNAACVLQGLTPGSKLHVPGDWPEPRPGVKTEIKGLTELAKSSTLMGIGLAVVGIAGIGGLAYVAYRQSKKRR